MTHAKYGFHLVVPTSNFFGDLVPMSRSAFRSSREHQEMSELLFREAEVGLSHSEAERLDRLGARIARRDWGEDPLGAWHGSNQ